ncbi:MAG: cache domain-containing protein, partial [Treponema sp.]|nr:cache domain-containing protein [Treponema sp.]
MKKKLFQLSFKQFVTSVIPYAVIAMYVSFSFAYLVNALIAKQVRNDTAALAKSAEYEIRLRFETPSIALNTLVGAVEEDSDRSYNSIKALVKSSGAQYPQCSAFYFVMLDGFASRNYTVIMSSGADTPSDKASLETLFAAPIAAKGELYSSETKDLNTDRPVISFTRAVYAKENHRLVGVAGCYLLLDQLAEGLKSLTTSDKESMNIVDAEGLFLTHDDASYVKTKNYFDVSPIGKKYKAAEYLDGNDRVLNEGGRYYGVRRIGVSPWSVVIEGPTALFTGTAHFWMIVINIVTIVLILLSIAYTTWYMNRMRGKERELGDKMFTETQNLAVAAKENAATSQDQSAAVKEIVATMEDNNALSENIAVKIKDVSSVAGKTSSDVAEG